MFAKSKIMATTTANKLLGKQKEDLLQSSYCELRNGRDSNPRPPA